MAVLLCITDRDVRPLRKRILEITDGRIEVWIYPEIPDPEKVEMVVLWKHPAGLLSGLPNLRLISSFGAGVEHILNDPERPPGVPVTRIVDEALARSMRSYVAMAAFNFHRNTAFFLANQQRSHWEKPEAVEKPLRIGVLGLGYLGATIAAYLASLDFDVLGYSRRPKIIEGVNCFNGEEESLSNFVSRINTLVCVLPRTPATEGILNYELFSRMQPGSFLVNVARGAHLVEPDLQRAMREGYIDQAYLDVFREEPLPSGHPFWKQPGLVITPHIAGITNQNNAAEIIAGNYRRLLSGRELRFAIDTALGY